MDSKKKDNLTDVVETLVEMENPEGKISEQTEHTVIADDGDVITLNQEESSNK